MSIAFPLLLLGLHASALPTEPDTNINTNANIRPRADLNLDSLAATLNFSLHSKIVHAYAYSPSTLILHIDARGHTDPQSPPTSLHQARRLTLPYPDLNRNHKHKRHQALHRLSRSLGLTRRCGSNTIHCDSNSNLAHTSACTCLYNALVADASTSISSSTTQACCVIANASDESSKCCTSWNQGISGLLGSDLITVVGDVTDRCQNGGKVSGWAEDVSLAGQCVHQCLSNADSSAC